MNPVPGQRPAWVDAELFPFVSRFRTVDGHTVHYVDEGDGPVLLMLHGNPVWSFVYRQVIAELRGDFRCVALDYPGFGLSTAAPGYGFLPADHAAVVARFVDELALSDITLVVNDWGGPIGLSVAGNRPDRFLAHFPAATTVHLPGAGHFVASDAPDEVVGAIRAWHQHTAAQAQHHHGGM